MNFRMIQPWLNVLKDQQSRELRRIRTKCPAVYLYDTHIIRPWQNEEQKVDKQENKTTLHKDGSSALLDIALKKEEEKKKKKIITTRVASIFIMKTFVLEFIQCRTLLRVLYRVCNSQTEYYRNLWRNGKHPLFLRPRAKNSSWGFCSFLLRMRRRIHFSQRRIQVGMLIENFSTFYEDFSTKISCSSLVFMDYGLRGTDKGTITFNFLLWFVYNFYLTLHFDSLGRGRCSWIWRDFFWKQ